MMIEPQAGALISRICNTLEDALRDMAAPYAQRQLKAGLWTLRELAARVDAQPQRVREDIADMELALALHGAAGAADVGSAEVDVKMIAEMDADADAAQGLADARRHVLLQARIEALEAHSPSAALRELHARMLRRELAAGGGD